MSQASLSSYFIARKRGIEDDVIASKKKVICLERTSDSSASQAGPEDLKTVFPTALPQGDSECPQKELESVKRVARQCITAQRATRSKRVHMQTIDGKETPKIVNFFKGGNLSPQKKSKASTAPVEATPAAKVEAKNNEAAKTIEGLLTPKKTVATDAIDTTPLLSTNGMTLDEVKKKLKGSAKLTEMKTILNKLQAGHDKLDRMEKMRLAADALRQKKVAAAEPSKALKPFKSIELEIMR